MKTKKTVVARRTGKYTVPEVLRPAFYRSVAQVLRNARVNAYRAVNFVMVAAYWNVGRMIVEEEQHGQKRAEYGENLLANLALRLTEEFGAGYTERNLRNFRQFFVTFPIRHAVRAKSPVGRRGRATPDQSDAIRHALRAELTWTHYRLLMRLEKPEARDWYMREAADQNWSSRALERQINALYYERLLMSRDKVAVASEAKEKTTPLAPAPTDFIKDPFILEFLGLPDAHQFRESELEQAIIGKLQSFMLELGKGFAFVARQQRVSTETTDFFMDLVFYNYLLKCFVLIDLKTGALTHQDIGQMDMYVRLYEDKMKGPADNPTVGIILCTERDQTVVKYSVLNRSRRLFAARYKLYLPSEQELIAEIEREKALIVREREVLYG